MSDERTLRFGEPGVLRYDPARQALECGLCGAWCRGLGQHVWLAHHVTAAAYRALAGLNRRTKLITPELHATLRARALPRVAEHRAEGKLKRFNEDPERLRRANVAAAVAMTDGIRAEGRRHLSESATPERRAARGAKISASRQCGAAPPRPSERCGTTYRPTGTRQRYCAACGPLVQRERWRERDARRRDRVAGQ